MDVQAEVDLPAQRQKRAWAPAVLLCILASPVFLVLKTLAFMLGLKLFLFLFGAFLVVAVVGFLLGPVSVVWSGYIAVTEVIFGLSEDHKYFLCCSSKDRFEAEVVSWVPVLMFPAGITSCLLLARSMFWKSLTLRQMILVVAVSTVIAQGLLWYYEWQEVIVNCSAVQCNF
ncbi:hypothetical protein GGE16_000857 [Rhizobium leguminosarum]|uniref:Uncharacterized protein n=1 Tax=Rhizobium leguminosarum TaxID=384 RepID=A0AAE2MGF6_RHILE|nr:MULTISPECIES: hypothetical protein [Rhizobium]MBB4288841.1 hypothetical protein [Rhizobium leguminosarum]MBB4295065.1 hypothetical protein [Rhizobium leguminosarum]MBB4306459.1 hypothetical protein [Rhizobium leguminosarum]MBB4417961.1 hypothetical protein [Rhizobium leguminosarum]MBB4432806.1 hypothetical protein [Rhizobium esperanzae]